MATTIITKNGSGAPDPSDLSTGELAIDLTNKRIYTKDSGGTVLELGTNTGSSLSITGDLTVDTDTLVVDSTNDRVGIGTSPSHPLHVSADVTGGDLVYFNNENAVASDVLRLNTLGIGSGTNILDCQSGSVSKFVVTGNGNVGIGTDSPDVALQVSGDIRTTNGTSAYLKDGAPSASEPSYTFNGDTDTGMYRAAANTIGFTTSGSEAVRIDSSGNVGIGVGNGDGYGITFNSTAHNAATTLDYYEEGFVNLEIADAQTGGNVASVGEASCFYTRIGRMVYCSINIININTTGLNSENFVYIRNLPFTVLNGTGTNYAAVGFIQNIGAAGTDIRQSFGLGFIENTTYCQIVASGEGRIRPGDLLNVSDVLSGVNNISANVFYFA